VKAEKKLKLQQLDKETDEQKGYDL